MPPHAPQALALISSLLCHNLLGHPTAKTSPFWDQINVEARDFNLLEKKKFKGVLWVSLHGSHLR